MRARLKRVSLMWRFAGVAEREDLAVVMIEAAAMASAPLIGTEECRRAMPCFGYELRFEPKQLASRGAFRTRRTFTAARHDPLSPADEHLEQGESSIDDARRDEG